LLPGQEDDDEYIFDDSPLGMKVQEGNDQAEEAIDLELRRVPPTQSSSILNRDNAWLSSNCSDDWIWSGEPDEQWEQCPIDMPERMGAEMFSSQGHTFASDSGLKDESESHPSACINVTTNLTRKRTLT
jgi:hypothetical protein